MKMSAELTACVDQSLAEALGLDDADFTNLPHRRWLYGTHLLRQEVTVIAAPSGIGKSSLAIGMAVCMAVDKDLLGETIWGTGSKVLYINGEDDREEMLRRVDAFCDKHKVAQQNLTGRFFVFGKDNWETQKLRLLHIEKQTSRLHDNGIAHLEAMLDDIRPDLVVLDPLVNFCAGGDVDDDAVMALVMMKLKRMARKFECAVLIVHHATDGRRLSGVDIRGASTTIVPIPMTAEKAKRLGVLPSERWRYFKLCWKSKLAPRSDEAPWYERVNIELPNAEPPTYPSGDEVRVVVRAKISPARNAASGE
jgi:AAA domain-containing protein